MMRFAGCVEEQNEQLWTLKPSKNDVYCGCCSPFDILYPEIKSCLRMSENVDIMMQFDINRSQRRLYTRLWLIGNMLFRHGHGVMHIVSQAPPGRQNRSQAIPIFFVFCSNTSLFNPILQEGTQFRKFAFVILKLDMILFNFLPQTLVRHLTHHLS